MKGSDSMYYVYRFIEGKEVVYIGKTNDIYLRMSQHSRNKEWITKNTMVEYITFKTKTEMDIYELYYISKWQPKHNTKSKREEIMELVLDEFTWIRFMPKEEIREIDTLRKENDKLKSECVRLQLMNDLLTTTRFQTCDMKTSEVRSRSHNSDNLFESIAIPYYDVIEIVKLSKSESIIFTSELKQNNESLGVYTIYLEGKKIFLSYGSIVEEIYNLDKNVEQLVLGFAPGLKYIPSSKLAYHYIASKYYAEYKANNNKHALQEFKKYKKASGVVVDEIKLAQ